MTPTILGADYATRVRSRLGVQESHLSVTEIDEHLPEVEAVVCGIVTDYETILSQGGDPKTYLQSAVVCLLSSALCPLLKAKYPLREQGPGGTFETTINWDKRKEELELDYRRFLSLVKPPILTPRFRVV